MVIDLTSKKLLAGHARRGLILDFADVTQIMYEDVPMGQRATMHYLKIRTNNFNSPLLSVSFDNKIQRDNAYSKLHTALGC